MTRRPETDLLTDLLRHSDLPGRAVTCRSRADLAAAAARATNGDHILAFAHPDSWAHLPDITGTVAAARADHDPATPHVTATRSAAGAGQAAGHLLPLRRTGSLTRPADARDAAAWPDGTPAATTIARGLGTLTIIAGTLPSGQAGTAVGWAGAAARRRVDTTSPQPDTPSAPATGNPAVSATPVTSARTIPTVDMGDWEPPTVDARDVNDDALLRAAAHAGRTLPAAVYAALTDLADGRSTSGALLIRGCPTGPVPATPPSPEQAAKPNLTSEATLLTVARILGQPVGYAPEHGGDIVQNVCPVAAHADRQTSTSSAVILELHTEAAFHPVRPRYLALLCLRGDPASATTLTSVHSLLAALTPAERALLAQPRYTTGVDESYTDGRGTARSAPASILSGHPDSPRLWLDNDLMTGDAPDTQTALQRAADLARELATGVVLTAGDLLIVDNDVAVHGRTPFTPRYDGTDRWLQRTLIVTDHRNAAGDLDGRIITTEFNLS